MISIIAAIARNNVIGKDGELAWHLPADLKMFKTLTTEHTIIMGRKTFETCVKRILPNRQNIIITRDPLFTVEGAEIAHSLDEALKKATHEVFIIGGGEIYRQAIDRVQRMFITEVDAHIEGNVFFPTFDRDQWQEVNRQTYQKDERHPYNYTFTTLIRR